MLSMDAVQSRFKNVRVSVNSLAVKKCATCRPNCIALGTRLSLVQGGSDIYYNGSLVSKPEISLRTCAKCAKGLISGAETPGEPSRTQRIKLYVEEGTMNP